MFHLERFAIQMLSSSVVGAFFILIQVRGFPEAPESSCGRECSEVMTRRFVALLVLLLATATATCGNR